MDKKQLCFLISHDFCSFVLIQNEDIILYEKVNFDNKNEEIIKDDLISTLKKVDLVKFNVDYLTISVLTAKTTILPSSVFQIAHLKNYFLASFENLNPNHSIDFNRISKLSIVTIYEISNWIKSFFVLRFPSVSIQNFATIVINGMLEINSNELSINISIFSDIIFITIIEKNELLFCNNFSVNNENDVIYYLGFTLQQLKLTDKKGKIVIDIEANLAFTNQESFSKNINKINIFNNFEKHFETNHHFKLHQFCV
jgi:hypothetical protein